MKSPLSSHQTAPPFPGYSGRSTHPFHISILLKFSVFLCIFTFFYGENAGGAEADEADQKPTVLSADKFKEVLEKSPFTRTLNLSDTLSLTGVAHIDGKPVLTLLNRSTNESHLVSEEPNAKGWRLLEIDPSSELGKVEAKVSAGDGEVVSVRFGEGQLNPVEDRKSKKPGDPPQPGAQRPPAPPQGQPQGPNPAIMEKYKTLSPEQQQRFREVMREQFTKNKNMTPQQRTQLVERALSNMKR